MTPPSPTKRIYLAGPMQGIPHFNFPRFNGVAAALRHNGHEVFNPAERDIERHGGVDISRDNTSGTLANAKSTHGFSLRDALKDDTAFICDKANAIVLLPGWEKSNGAQAEHRLCVALQSEGMEIVYLSEEIALAMQQFGEHLAAEKQEKASA